MVDKSSVQAVEKARNERDQAIRDKKEFIRAVQSQANHDVYEARQKQEKAEMNLKITLQTLKSRCFLYIGLLAFTLICIGIMNPQVSADFVNFFTTPFIGLYNLVCSYTNWLINLSHKIELGWAWVVRILLTIFLISLVCYVIKVIICIIKWYKNRWCTLSLKTMVITLAIIIVFGESIRKVISINLILLFFLVQLCYLFVLWYFDGYFANRYRSDEWERIQNR